MTFVLVALFGPAPSEDDLNRFVFFAVVEGLFEDGVPDRLVEKILETDNGRYVNFVYACSICTPSVEAFRLYAGRRSFYYSRKGDPYIGESNLPKEIEALLAEESIDKRRQGIQKLIDRFISKRLARLRLSEEEKRPWQTALEIARKKGMELLQSDKRNTMKSCPSCDGGVDGSRRK